MRAFSLFLSSFVFPRGFSFHLLLFILFFFFVTFFFLSLFFPFSPYFHLSFHFHCFLLLQSWAVISNTCHRAVLTGWTVEDA